MVRSERSYFQPNAFRNRTFQRCLETMRTLQDRLIIETVETQSGGFGRRVLGRVGIAVSRLGIAASYGVPGAAVESAFERGVNYLYWGSRRTDAFCTALRNLRLHRERMVLVVQSYTRMAALMAGSLERALRRANYDHADVLLLGMWNKPVVPRILDAARQLRERGLTRFLAVSTHARTLVPPIAEAHDFDIVHFRYNAAHRGAEMDIFPHLLKADKPGLVAFTATSWGQLLGVRSIQAVFNGGYRLPKGERTPTATDCYRFVLTRPEVDVCMAGPANASQMEQALEALRLGPMTEDEIAWMGRIGRAVAGK
jgi:aryl-alcohol dehydrogenase-like predicted oxidoreductase